MNDILELPSPEISAVACSKSRNMSVYINLIFIFLTYGICDCFSYGLIDILFCCCVYFIGEK